MFSRTKVLSKIRLPDFMSRLLESTDQKAKKSLNHLFIDERVQNLLKKLTKVDYDKVFKPRQINEKPEAPTYKLLCTEEVERESIMFKKKADYLLQMPPVVDIREEINEILCVDPDLDGHDKHHSNYIFADTSFDVNYRERVIVVREPNGVLRKAHWEERDRINQMYDPIPGKEIFCPKMFENENLMNVLEREEYEFVLDRACIQFEPDDPMYHKVTELTYGIINSQNHFSKLQSTRHFGCLVFYLVKNKMVDNLLMDYIDSENIEDAFDLVKLYHIIHPDCKSAKVNETDEMKMLNAFIEEDSKNANELKLSLKKYEVKQKEKNAALQEIQEAHGAL